jgi:hypothetical protein
VDQMGSGKFHHGRAAGEPDARTEGDDALPSRKAGADRDPEGAADPLARRGFGRGANEVPRAFQKLAQQRLEAARRANVRAWPFRSARVVLQLQHKGIDGNEQRCASPPFSSLHTAFSRAPAHKRRREPQQGTMRRSGEGHP